MGECCSKAYYDQLQNSQEDSDEEYEGFEIIHPVVVTGFGRIDPKEDKTDESNLSWRVVEKLNEIITDNQGRAIPVIKGKPRKEDKTSPEPVKVCYSYVKDSTFKGWLDSTDALVYLHLGVKETPLPRGPGESNLIHLETTARRDDIDFERDKYPHDIDDTPSKSSRLYPNLDFDKKPGLRTSFDVPNLVKSLNEKFKSGVALKSCSTSSIKLSFERSDDAQNSLCDFLYYVSLDLATERDSLNPHFPRNVLFIHIPQTLCLVDDNVTTCYEHCISEKAEALAEVIKFIVKELLAQLDAAKDRTTTMER